MKLLKLLVYTTQLLRVACDCVSVQAFSWGFGSTLLHLVHLVRNYGYTNIYWDFTPAPYTCCSRCHNNGWSGLFNDLPLESCKNTHDRWWFGQTALDNSVKRLEGICEAITDVWKPAHTVQDIIDYELGKIEMYPKPVVAFQVRGGDKTRVTPTNSGELPPGYNYDVEGAVNRLNMTGGTCVILGDDSILADRVVTALGKRCFIINRVLPHHAHNQTEFNVDTEKRRCQSTKDLLVDINILARANKTVGLGVSNVVRLAALLQQCWESRQDFTDWGGMNVTELSYKPQGF
jgi:hypothetical protein